MVYNSARDAGVKVRRCDKGGTDTFSYTSEIRDGICQSCASTQVVKQRRYTPDLCVIQSPHGPDDFAALSGANKYYVEAKGYLRASERALLRSLVASKAVPDLRIVLQADYRIGKLTFGGWIDRYLKIKWAVFDGKWPETWNERKEKQSTKAGNKRVRKSAV